MTENKEIFLHLCRFFNRMANKNIKIEISSSKMLVQ